MLILFVKARAKWDTHTPDLFDAITQVHGYTRADGTFVPPHSAHRMHAVEPHHVVDVANLSNNGGKPHKEPQMESNTQALTGIPAAIASLKPGIEYTPDAGPTPLARPNQRDVPEHLLERVEAIIAKANKRAVKLGVEGFKLTKGVPFDRPIRGHDGFVDDVVVRYERMVPCTIEGPTIKAPGGWSLAGRVDFEDGTTVVNSKPGTQLPVRYRSIKPTCEHCNSDRQRNAVFVFSDGGGKYLQVGRQCLKDYLGHDPAATLWAASEFGGVFDEIDREIDEGRGRASQMIGLEDVMTAAVWAVREYGFVSRKAAEERGGVPTSSSVDGALFNPKERAEYLKRVTPADTEKAKAVIAWVQSEWGGKGDQASDYEHNGVELTARTAVHTRRIGLLTSLVSAYDRANEERVVREKRVNAWVGTVGERREFTTTFAGANSFDTAYGVMFVMRFDSPEGLLVYKGSTPDWAVDANGGKALEAGDEIKFVGTIKEHADYKGTKQTLVSRCAVIKPKPVKVKAAKKLIVRTEALAA